MQFFQHRHRYVLSFILERTHRLFKFSFKLPTIWRVTKLQVCHGIPKVSVEDVCRSVCNHLHKNYKKNRSHTSTGESDNHMMQRKKSQWELVRKRNTNCKVFGLVRMILATSHFISKMGDVLWTKNMHPYSLKHPVLWLQECVQKRFSHLGEHHKKLQKLWKVTFRYKSYIRPKSKNVFAILSCSSW